jgi:MoaA/NifB/PqqE/SkfB family radical SAM enzyme
MIIKRKESWGMLTYNTKQHSFHVVSKEKGDITPYSQLPVLLNIDLTMKCNMSCIHCVAKDFEQPEDLIVTYRMIDWINQSPFMVIVITGGEPLLSEYEATLKRLLVGVKNKGLILDTNGTIIPSQQLIKTICKTDTLVRVSWDSTRPQDETYFRRATTHDGVFGKESEKLFNIKRENILKFRSQGVNIAVQSVVHKKNLRTILSMPLILAELSIKKWYVQRYIPSYKVADHATLNVTTDKYEEVISELVKNCQKYGIECITKRDKRHNCVYLLVGDGKIYTQHEFRAEKVLLGTINSKIDYSGYVSVSDHADRYYRCK